MSSDGSGPMSAVERLAGWVGTAVALASLGLVALADLGWFRSWGAGAVVIVSVVGAAFVWRPWIAAPRPRLGQALLAAGVLLVGAALVAPGSESIVGPRDPGVYVATGFAIARWGGATVHDPGLELLAETMEPGQINAWLYENAYNHARVRFPTQLFVRDFKGGVVEGGFLPVLPAWIALAAGLGGIEAALHVSGAFGLLSLAFVMLACRAASKRAPRPPFPNPSTSSGQAPPPQGRRGPVRDSSPDAQDKGDGDPSLSPTGGEGEGANARLPDAGPAPDQGTLFPSSLVPSWPIVGAVLALAFSQVWWAREPMAEPALGAFSWLVAWACIRWVSDGGWRWSALGALGCVAALFIRADAVLLVGAFGLVVLLLARTERRVALLVLLPGIALAVLHDALIAPIYMSTTYGAFTLGRAIAGVVGLGLVVLAALGVAWARRTRARERAGEVVARSVVWGRRLATMILIVVALASAASGFAPGLGRAASVGAISPLAWLPGYVPWPILILAGIGTFVVGWWSAPHAVVPLLLVGGLPALLYLPDPLVTGDHPWMVRRLVPAVVPLLAILASVGVTALARGVLSNRMRGAGSIVAAVLVGLGLALEVAMDRDLVGPRHAAGAVAGVRELAAAVPPNALVVFPVGQAGVHLALPLGYDFGVDAFAIPSATMTPEIATTLARMEAAGRSVYWAEEGTGTPSFPDGVSAQAMTTVHAKYPTADGGRTPPPLDFGSVDHVVTLHRVTFR